ncbi:MAG: MFS transporter [Labilithrix sp.]|nr:MFS transporter [Labilithrix sp.]MCW5836900.1 MFS transporter [Labilithrix sp.]
MTERQYVETDLPVRLDRLPWSRWHWRVVIALGVTWLLDGLEVTLVGAVAAVLREPETLHLTEGEIGASVSAYLAGAVLGALFFGRLTDKLGRKKLFFVTLAVYLSASFFTAFTNGFVSFAVLRFVTGAGIGGEYAAINAAIDELIPARVRGRADLGINGTYWLGAALGALGTIVLLDPNVLPRWLGWRVCFGLGASLGLVILFTRRHLPESPRWLIMHGRVEEAERVVSGIEEKIREEGRAIDPPERLVTVDTNADTSWGRILRVLFIHHRRRAILGLVLMVAQAFAYNGVFFTYPLVLGRFYEVPADDIGLYLLPFAFGNLFGPLVLGPLFDHIGRRAMIATTYGLTGVLLALTGLAFAYGAVGSAQLTAMWCLVFFFASAAASSAYLTVSELFPVELRGMAIAVFYAAGTGAGGVLAPALFGVLVGTGSRVEVLHGYLLGAGLMVFAALIALFLALPAEKRSLEEIAVMADVRRDRS